MKGNPEETKEDLVLKCKQQTSIEDLCKGLPIEFEKYMRYLQHLENPNRPDYAYLRKLFSNLLRRSSFQHDHVFDWTILEFDRLVGGDNIT